MRAQVHALHLSGEQIPATFPHPNQEEVWWPRVLRMPLRAALPPARAMQRQRPQDPKGSVD